MRDRPTDLIKQTDRRVDRVNKPLSNLCQTSNKSALWHIMFKLRLKNTVFTFYERDSAIFKPLNFQKQIY